MITYFYWAMVIILAMTVLFFLGRADQWKKGLIGSLIIFVIGWGTYFFHFQQVFVKHYGGVMSITVPDGQVHLAATWKDDNLWIENYEPATNTCHFNEYSRGNMLQGKVTIKNCNPLLPREDAIPTSPAAPLLQQ
ncbi:hypothetical protein MNBD_GAMMA25-1244 [hydrothermal vent metagenome]|uniref:Uncharacterized protein n=1 Tax=hydrothermal vent metagenome TaxID=652676 RepID=A0A3B1BCL5_9ZZZZ